MSPDQRTELESLVAAHVPPVAGSQRERLLFDAARELGRQQGSRQVVRKSVAAAAVSCGLTLLLSWAAMPGLRSSLAPTEDAMPGARLADSQPPSSQPSAKSIAQASAERIADTPSATFPARRSAFDQHVLTPASWSARWELSHLGSLNADSTYLQAADGATAADLGDSRRSASTPLRAGTPLDQL